MELLKRSFRITQRVSDSSEVIEAISANKRTGRTRRLDAFSESVDRIHRNTGIDEFVFQMDTLSCPVTGKGNLSFVPSWVRFPAVAFQHPSADQLHPFPNEILLALKFLMFHSSISPWPSESSHCVHCSF